MTERHLRREAQQELPQKRSSQKLNRSSGEPGRRAYRELTPEHVVEIAAKGAATRDVSERCLRRGPTGSVAMGSASKVPVGELRELKVEQRA